MPELIIENLAERRINYKNAKLTILQVVQGEYLDWMHLCGGKGRCVTCAVKVVKGHENLSPRTASEERFARMGWLEEDERLSCQCRASGKCTLRVPERNQLPHVEYKGK